jgi:hypothetical protein
MQRTWVSRVSPDFDDLMVGGIMLVIGLLAGWIAGVVESRYLYERMMRRKACDKDGCPNRVAPSKYQ